MPITTFGDQVTTWAPLRLHVQGSDGDEVAVYATDSDPRVGPGLPANAGDIAVWKAGTSSEILVKRTSADTGWVAAGLGGGTTQAFTYTATGLEADPAELTIPLPATRADANYLVFWSQGAATVLLAGRITTKTVDDFVLTLSADSSDNDEFNFHVVDPS